KLHKAEALGADILINRTKETEWSKSLYQATQRNGADVVIDNVGSTFPHSLRALRKGGRLLTVGNSASPLVELDNRFIFARHLSIIGSTMSTLADFKEVMDLIVTGRLPIVIDKTYPLSEAAVAQDRLWNGENFGKITLDIP
ncbi:MAG: zinc-binding dehydrogenase, partial [Chloroflexi bacterium]|nr:zinc-binding dehydrogenase [Chloroflexota bacterium]